MRAARLWPLAIAAVLAVTVGANVVAFYLAHGPGAAVVEPDYYYRAVRWDSTLAEDRRSAALGWTVEAEIGKSGPGGTPVSARLTDGDGTPLAGATVRVRALSNLDAARPLKAELAAGASGVYSARLPLRRLGLWELRFDVARGADRFTRTLRREATPGDGRVGP